MKNFRKIALALTASLSITAFSGCGMFTETEDKIKRDAEQAAKVVVAKGTGFEITQGEVDQAAIQQLEMLKQQYKDPNAKEAKEKTLEAKKAVAEDLVKAKVFLQMAQKKFKATDSDIVKQVEDQLTMTKKQFKTDKEFLDALTKAKIKDVNEYKTKITEGTILRKYVTELTDKNVVSDASIKSYYEANKKNFEAGPGANLFHIIFGNDDAAKKKAEEAKAAIDKGASFAEMAKKYGQDGTKDKGGELGFYTWDNKDLDPLFTQAASKLKDGEVSAPVKSSFGWHLIKITGLTKETKVKPLESVKEEITKTVKNQMDQKTLDTEYAKYSKELKVEKLFDFIK